MEAWWKSERFRLTRRSYTAREVVSLRGNLRQSYGSNEMAKKLWRTLKTHHANGTASRTFGALDPVQVTQMAKHLDTIYVSGWQCSSTHTTSNEPGPDLADYPYDTVPNKVNIIHIILSSDFIAFLVFIVMISFRLNIYFSPNNSMTGSRERRE